MNKNLLDDRTILYKYTSAETALKILHSQQIRLSTLSNLNDPFEVQPGKYVEFDENSLKKDFLEKQIAFLHGELNPKFPNAFSNSSLTLVKDSILKNPSIAPKDELRQLLAPVADELILELKKNAQKFSTEIWNSAFKDWIVFSTSLTPNDVLMFTHYGDQHKGVMIGFQCIRSLDTALSASKKMHYQENPPALYNQEQYLKNAFGEEMIDYDENVLKLLFTKNSRWAYEREMRLAFPAKNLDDDGYSYINIHPLEIHSLYFGCRISQEAKNSISDLLNKHYPHTKKFALNKNPERGEFEIISE